MKPINLSLLMPLLAACTREPGAATVVPQVVPTELVVASDGQDSGPGTRAAPLRTLARAAALVKPGTLVLVMPGTYEGGLRTTVDGLPGARIVFRAAEPGSVRIIPPAQVGTLGAAGGAQPGIAWDNRASRVDIEGFEVDGAGPDGSGNLWRTGIYSAGSDTRITGNHVHHIATGIACTPAGGAGIGVDGYYRGSGAEVDGNRVHDIGPEGCRFVQGIYVAMPARVRNNIVYRVAEAAIHLWHDAHHVLIANNTVAASHTGILVGGGDFYHVKGPNDGTRVINNIVFDNAVGVSEQGETGPHNLYTHNLVYGSSEADWRLAEGMTHTDTVAARPGFFAYERAGTPDFRLAPGSPAIARGLAAGAPATDFHGRSRARAPAVDIGACQHTPGHAAASAVGAATAAASPSD